MTIKEKVVYQVEERASTGSRRWLNLADNLNKKEALEIYGRWQKHYHNSVRIIEKTTTFKVIEIHSSS